MGSGEHFFLAKKNYDNTSSFILKASLSLSSLIKQLGQQWLFNQKKQQTCQVLSPVLSFQANCFDFWEWCQEQMLAGLEGGVVLLKVSLGSSSLAFTNSGRSRILLSYSWIRKWILLLNFGNPRAGQNLYLIWLLKEKCFLPFLAVLRDHSCESGDTIWISGG